MAEEARNSSWLYIISLIKYQHFEVRSPSVRSTKEPPIKADDDETLPLFLVVRTSVTVTQDRRRLSRSFLCHVDYPSYSLFTSYHYEKEFLLPVLLSSPSLSNPSRRELTRKSCLSAIRQSETHKTQSKSYFSNFLVLLGI